MFKSRKRKIEYFYKLSKDENKGVIEFEPHIIDIQDFAKKNIKSKTFSSDCGTLNLTGMELTDKNGNKYFLSEESEIPNCIRSFGEEGSLMEKITLSKENFPESKAVVDTSYAVSYTEKGIDIIKKQKEVALNELRDAKKRAPLSVISASTLTRPEEYGSSLKEAFNLGIIPSSRYFSSEDEIERYYDFLLENLEFAKKHYEKEDFIYRKEEASSLTLSALRRHFEADYEFELINPFLRKYKTFIELGCDYYYIPDFSSNVPLIMKILNLDKAGTMIYDHGESTAIFIGSVDSLTDSERKKLPSEDGCEISDDKKRKNQSIRKEYIRHITEQPPGGTDIRRKTETDPKDPFKLTWDESRKSYKDHSSPDLDIEQVTYEEEIFNKLKESGE